MTSGLLDALCSALFRTAFLTPFPPTSADAASKNLAYWRERAFSFATAAPRTSARRRR
jgi:hypothetical protein